MRGNVANGAFNEQDYLKRLHEMEGRLVRDAMEKKKLREETEKNAQLVADMKIKYQQVKRLEERREREYSQKRFMDLTELNLCYFSISTV